MSKENPFRKAISSRQPTKDEQLDTASDVPPESLNVSPPPPVQNIQSVPAQALTSPEPKRRGRPATGKRSDNAWVGRTFYIQRENDLDVETELLNLKRQGIEIDKSELVDKLLAAWVKWQKGENIEIHLSEISPIQKSSKS